PTAAARAGTDGYGARARRFRNSASPSPVPKPQAALTIGPMSIAAGTKPAAIGWPFNGAATNQATSVGRTAPNSVAANTSAAPRSRASAAARTMPHTPPQNAIDHSCGTPKGAVAFME